MQATRLSPEDPVVSRAASNYTRLGCGAGFFEAEHLQPNQQNCCTCESEASTHNPLYIR